MESPDYATAADLKLVRDQVDQLQIAAAEKQQPWYKQRPSLASLLALAASIVTFIISQHGSSLQEIRSKQEALRKLLTDVVASQIQEQDQLTRISDPVTRVQFSSAMNNERIIWLDAAESLVDQLGKRVSSSEYQTLANQKWSNSEFEKAKEYYVKSLDAARDRFARTVAFRSLGSFYLQCPTMKNLEQGRECFEKAVATLENPTDDYSNYLMGYAYEFWAYGDQSNNLGEERAQHVKKAREYYSRISPANPLQNSALSNLAANNPDLPP
jgi:predicted transcriptional regulator